MLISKNKKAIWLLLAANSISGIAQGISMLAIPWYLIAIQNQGGLFAKALAAFTLISVIWSIYAGSIIDKYSRKRVFIILNAICAVVLLAISLIGYLQNGLSTIAVLFVMLITQLNYNLHYPALYAFAQEVSPSAMYGRIISWLEIQGQSTNIIAGAVAAMLLAGIDSDNFLLSKFGNFLPNINIEPWPLHKVFLLDGFTYIVALLLIVPMQYASQKTKQVAPQSTLFGGIFIGLQFLRERKALFILGIFAYSVFITSLVAFKIIVPGYVKNWLCADASLFATADLFLGVGALLSGLFINRLIGSSNRLKGIIIQIVVVSFLYFWLMLSKSPSVLLIGSLLLGVANTGVRILRWTFLFEVVDNQIIGRVSGLFKMFETLLRAGFILLFSLSWFQQGTQIRFGFGVFGIFTAISAIGIWYFLPKLRLLEKNKS